MLSIVVYISAAADDGKLWSHGDVNLVLDVDDVSYDPGCKPDGT